MRMRKPRVFITVSLMLASAGCMHTNDPVRDWLNASRAQIYRAPTAVEHDALVRAFESALDGQLDAKWGDLGFELQRFPPTVALRDASLRGWGGYVVREGAARALVVQAPHADSDRLTGDIALRIATATGARVTALNSAPRYVPGADQAHAPRGPFAALGLAATRAGHATVQLHGFGEDTAHRYALADDAVVVSNGTTAPDAELRSTSACLQSAGFDARLFPEHAAYPGGTRNAVGAVIRGAGTARFVHLEIGARLRAALVRHPARLEAFAACL